MGAELGTVDSQLVTKAQERRRDRWFFGGMAAAAALAGRDPDRFEQLVPLGIDPFTEAVFLAENLDSQTDRDLRNQVRECVAKHFVAWGAKGSA